MRGLVPNPDLAQYPEPGLVTNRRITIVECDDCSCTKIKCQIHYQAYECPEKAGSRLALDFHDFELDKDSYNSVILITDCYSGYIWDFYLKNQTRANEVQALKQLFRILDYQYQIKPEVIETDNEILKGFEGLIFSFYEGLYWELSAPYTQAQNSTVEYSGGVIETKSNTIRSGAKLPAYLM